MAYIGTPVQQALTKVTSQSFNGTGSQTVFTLNRAVNTGEELEVFVNNVQQEPGVGKSYTATGTTLTFDAAPSSGTGNIYVIYRGLAEVTRRLEHDPNAALAATTGTFSGDLTVDTNTLYVDSTNNRVGIGTATPNEALTIEAPLSGNTGLAINYSGDNKAGITANPITGQIQVGAHPDLTSANAYYLSFNTASSNTVYERMKIDSSGRVTMPYQPRFSGVGFAGAGSVNTPLSLTNFTWATVHVNDGNHFNNTTGLYTCPVAGKYLVQLFYNRRSIIGNWTGAAIQKSNAVQLSGWFPPSSDPNYTYAPVGISLILSCSVNDTIGLSYYNAYASPSSDTLGNSGSIMLIG
jgi:hypothetical protein